jgi:hypothetical protein
MTTFPWTISCLAVLTTAFSALAQDEPFLSIPEREHVLATLREEHPRLLIEPDAWVRVRAAIATDRRVSAWHEKLVRQADDLLDAPPSEYVIPDGKRLLATSRRVRDRVMLLAYAHHTTGDSAYVDRAWAELESAGNFKDWNPSHFLDTGEMTAAFAIGYDWLYGEWSDEQRAFLQDAIIKHGLTPGLKSYRGEERYGWFVRSVHNWNQVCNGGLALGALAIADTHPEIAAEIVHGGLLSLPRAMREFAPDGGWAEGPGYWNYATAYNVLHLAALEAALGTDFGFCDFPGFDRTGEFPVFISSPTTRTFNYADGRDSPIRAWQLFWLADRFSQPDYAAFEVTAARPMPLDVLWGVKAGLPHEMSTLPLDRHFDGVGAVTMRSAWNDPDALFVGLKGGSNAVNHSQLELGSFVFDAGGVRWAMDTGRDDYNMPAYFGNKRWTYYRLRAEGQNTIVFAPGGGPEQDPKASAKVIETRFGESEAWAGVDLTKAYASALRGGSASRRVGLVGGRSRLVIEDRIEPGGAEPLPAWWFMHTTADVQVDDSGRRAVLRQDGKALIARIDEPSTARFTLTDARPLPTSPDPSMQHQNEGIRKLAIELAIAGPTTVRVEMQLASDDVGR